MPPSPKAAPTADAGMIAELPIAARALQLSTEALARVERHEDECRRHDERTEARWSKIAEQMERAGEAMRSGFEKLADQLGSNEVESSQKRAELHGKIDRLRNWVVGLVVTGLASTVLLLLSVVGYLVVTYALRTPA